EACQTILDRLDETVILSGFCGGEYQYSNGVSFFFPWSLECYLASRKNFKDLWINQRNRFNDGPKKPKEKMYSWNDFLGKYLTDVARRKSERFIATNMNDLAGNISQSSIYAGYKMAGLEGNKMAGLEGNKMAGLEGNKMAGLEGNKMAGLEG